MVISNKKFSVRGYGEYGGSRSIFTSFGRKLSLVFRFLGLFVVFQQIRYLFFILGNFWSFLLSNYEKIGKKGQRTGERKQKKRMRRGGKRKGQPLSGLSLALRG